ncbi:conserved phage C-terminal domain-containing protein [Clostridium sp.]|uniref:conserved phage C-terminal domain-containing protein n=1 Tax=Clostridium sp. TaxID=1506 RepID=UPI0032166CFB
MKYTIMGFRQEKLVELGLDVLDATILRYFIDFKEAKGMKVQIVDGRAYYWIRYDGVIKELPILKMKKCTVQARFFKLRDAGVLTHQVIREGGTYSYFGIGSRYIELITGETNIDGGNTDKSNKGYKEDKEDRNIGINKVDTLYEDTENLENKVSFQEENTLKTMDENLDGTDKNQQGVGENFKSVDENFKGVDKNLKGCELKPTTNNPSTKDPSIKTNNNVFLKETAFEIIEYLNLQTGKKFKGNTKATVKLIQARLSEEFTVEDFKTVIHNMKSRWTGTKFQQYLVPTTLFGNKFESYLNQGKEVEQDGLKRGNVVSGNEESRAELEEKLRNMVLKEDM